MTQIHDLRNRSHESVYDATQCDENIKSGDILIVDGGLACLDRAWPVMIVGKSDCLHSFKLPIPSEKGFSPMVGGPFTQYKLPDGRVLLDWDHYVDDHEKRLLEVYSDMGQVDAGQDFEVAMIY